MPHYATNLGDEYVTHDARQPACHVRRSAGFRQMQDTDKMPFGAFRGRRMQDVPAGYLEELLDKSWISNWPQVEEYVERNQKYLNQEADRCG